MESPPKCVKGESGAGCAAKPEDHDGQQLRRSRTTVSCHGMLGVGMSRGEIVVLKII